MAMAGFPHTGREVFGLAGRLLLSLMVLAGFLLALSLVINVHKFLLASEAGLKNPPRLYVGKPAVAAGNPSVRPLWPEFPHSDPGNFQSAVINGVQVMTEQWQCGNTPEEILSYYREQMTARGWQDTTEKAYSLQPELGAGTNGVEDERYVSNYRKIMNSTLVFNRGDWSLHISTEPSSEGFRQTAVQFYAASTPFIGSLFQRMTSAAMENKNGRSLDVLQDSSSEHYHTTITTKNEPVPQALQETLVALGAKGWKPVYIPKQEAAKGSSFVWLGRGRQYAALSITALPHGMGTSITLTEVTPH